MLRHLCWKISSVDRTNSNGTEFQCLRLNLSSFSEVRRWLEEATLYAFLLYAMYELRQVQWVPSNVWRLFNPVGNVTCVYRLYSASFFTTHLSSFVLKASCYLVPTFKRTVRNLYEDKCKSLALCLTSN